MVDTEDQLEVIKSTELTQIGEDPNLFYQENKSVMRGRILPFQQNPDQQRAARKDSEDGSKLELNLQGIATRLSISEETVNILQENNYVRNINSAELT